MTTNEKIAAANLMQSTPGMFSAEWDLERTCAGLFWCAVASVAFMWLMAAWTLAHGAGLKAPIGNPKTDGVFSERDVVKGFLDLAFGSDLRLGDQGARIRRFDRPARFFLLQRGSIDRKETYRNILETFTESIPNIKINFVEHETDADVTILLVNEKQLLPSLITTIGRPLARAFSRRLDPQCVTHVQSDNLGRIKRVHSFIVVDQGDQIFLNCAYHETMHVFGLTHHADHNPWTALNQERTVNALSKYDRLLLTLLYHESVRPGMSLAQVRRVLRPLVRNVMISGED